MREDERENREVSFPEEDKGKGADRSEARREVAAIEESRENLSGARQETDRIGENGEGSKKVGKTGRRTVIATIVVALGAMGIGTAGFSWLRRSAATTGTVTRGVGSSSSVSGAACTQLVTELTEGPYYLNLEMVRKNITEGKAGIPLVLRVNVIDAVTCKAILNAAVDIWHCDALGIYSGYIAESIAANNNNNQAEGAPGIGGPPPGAPPASGSGTPGALPPGGSQQQPTDKKTFLRGVQITDQNGMVEFNTIYPGWYPTRTTHIHLKLHIDGADNNNIDSGGHVAHTGQLFFANDICEEVGKLEPYVNNKVVRTLLLQDTIFPVKNKAGAMLTLTPQKSGSLVAGFLGEVTVSVKPNVTPPAF